MNVRNSMILSLFFLCFLLFPDIGVAEKRVNQAEGNGKPAEKSMVVSKSDSKLDVNSVIDKPETASNDKVSTSDVGAQKSKKSQRPDIVVPQKERQPDPWPKSSKKLPAQASEKAKEARLEKTEKRKEANSNKPIHKMSETKKPSDVVEKTVSLEPGKKVRKEQLKDNLANRSDDNSEESLESNEINSATEVDNGSSPLEEDYPEDFPETEAPEFSISQAKPSGSIAKGQSSDQKVSSKSIFDLLSNSLEEIRVNFLQPYVMRQHIYRNQWVNAPPAPPPESALFSNNI